MFNYISNVIIRFCKAARPENMEKVNNELYPELRRKIKNNNECQNNLKMK